MPGKLSRVEYGVGMDWNEEVLFTLRERERERNLQVCKHCHTGTIAPHVDYMYTSARAGTKLHVHVHVHTTCMHEHISTIFVIIYAHLAVNSDTVVVIAPFLGLEVHGDI